MNYQHPALIENEEKIVLRLSLLLYGPVIVMTIWNRPMYDLSRFLAVLFSETGLAALKRTELLALDNACTRTRRSLSDYAAQVQDVESHR